MNTVKDAKIGFGCSIARLQDPAGSVNFFNLALITTFGKKRLFDLTICQNTADGAVRAQNYVTFGLVFIFEGNLDTGELRNQAATQYISPFELSHYARMGVSKLHKTIIVYGSTAHHFEFNPAIESTENDKPFGVCHLPFFNTGDFYLNPSGGRSALSWNGEIEHEIADQKYRLEVR